jgi:negative regulator of sigma E activity
MTSQFKSDPNFFAPESMNRSSRKIPKPPSIATQSKVIPLKPRTPQPLPWEEEDEELEELDERLELLSTYLDGEANASERQQVEAWLATDPQFKKLYEQMSAIGQGFQALPVLASDRAAEQIVSQIFDRVDCQTQQKRRWQGGAIAALFLAAISGLSLRSYAPQFASIDRPETHSSQSIALDGGGDSSSRVATTARGQAIVNRALFVE